MFFCVKKIVFVLSDQKLKYVVYKDDAALFLLPIQKMLQMFLPIIQNIIYNVKTEYYIIIS